VSTGGNVFIGTCSNQYTILPQLHTHSGYAGLGLTKAPHMGLELLEICASGWSVGGGAKGSAGGNTGVVVIGDYPIGIRGIWIFVNVGKYASIVGSCKAIRGEAFLGHYPSCRMPSAFH